MDPSVVLERFLDRPRVAYIRAILDAYGAAPGGLLANGLAFGALFTAVPIGLVTLGLAGQIAVDPDVQRQLAGTLGDLFPPLREVFAAALQALADGAGITSIVGLVATIWTVSQFYVTLDIAFARIFDLEPQRDGLQRTARGFVWVVLLLGTVVAIIVFTTLGAILGSVWSPGRALGTWLTSAPVLFGVLVVFLAVIYRTLPPRPPRWRSIGPPAVFVAIAFVVLSQLFVELGSRLVNAAVIVGSIATAFIALAWLSFVFQALLYGAAWLRVREQGGPLRGPASGSALGAPASTAEPGGSRE
jgi:membrane protein